MPLRMAAMFVVSAAVLGCEEEPPCTDNEECAETEVCIAGDCLAALGQEYLLSSASADGIPQSHPDGSGLWDMPGGMPDPYLTLEVESGWQCTTFHDNDTLEPMWPDLSCPSIVIDDTTSFIWYIFDDDEREDPELISMYAVGEGFPVQAAWLHDGSFTSTTEDVTVTFHFTPVQPDE